MNTIHTLHSRFLECSGVSIDTRNIQSNNIFFCLNGQNFNANQFAKQALELGAKYVVVDDPNYFDSSHQSYILVHNALESLQELAKFHREYTQTPLIALTGSNGKTTTKELIQAVMSKKFKTIATIGNLNNHIGVPLTLLRLQKDTEFGIIEMGANHQKEIAFLCDIAKPNYGYITNFGKAHLEGFGGIEGVIRGKSEMYDYLIKNNKTGIINLDDNIQAERAKQLKHVSFGFTSPNAQYLFDSNNENEQITINYQSHKISTHLSGKYNLPNLAAAITIGLHFGIPIHAIQSAIEEYIPTNNRSQWTKFGSNEILMDAYNANPSSMKVSIENFASLNKGNKIMILGDMFELGEYAKKEHQNIIDLALQTGIKTYFIGNIFYELQTSTKHFTFFKSFEDFQNQFNIHTLENQTLLIKGSRGMALERIIK